MRRHSLLFAALLALSPSVGALPSQPTAAPTLAEARELYTARRDSDAQAAFDRLLTADPANHEAVYHLGRLAIRRGDWKTAAERYERCTQISPTNALYWADLGEAYGKLVGKAGIFQQLGLAIKCRSALERAVELAPDELEYRHGLIEFYEKAPAIAGGGRDKALIEALKLGRRNPFDGALTTGAIHTRAKNWAEAEAALRAAAVLRPEAPEPQVRLGQVLARKGDRVAAKSAYEKALLLDPSSTEAAAGLKKLQE
jgi:Flp pilus assembly protein TadD